MKNVLPLPVKSSAAPAWILCITAFIRLFFTIAAIIAVRGVQSRSPGIKLHVTTFAIDFLLVALLCMEAFIYWKIRKKIYKRSWVIIHLLLMVVIMVIVPLIYIATPLLINNYMPLKDSGKVISQVHRAGYYSFWVCVVTGNIFFIATVIKSFQFKPGLQDDTGLMDI